MNVEGTEITCHAEPTSGGRWHVYLRFQRGEKFPTSRDVGTFYRRGSAIHEGRKALRKEIKRREKAALFKPFEITLPDPELTGLGPF